MFNILCVNFDENLEKRMSSEVNSIGGDFRLHFFPLFKIPEYVYDDLSLIIFSENDGLSETELCLENIKSRFNDIPLAVIINNKSYDMALLCYRYSVCDIIDPKFNRPELMRTLLRAKIWDKVEREKNTTIPYFKLLNMFSMPSNINTSSQIINVLNEYLKYFNNIGEYFLVKQYENTFIELSKKEQIQIHKFNKKLIRKALKDLEPGDFSSGAFLKDRSNSNFNLILLYQNIHDDHKKEYLYLIIHFIDDNESSFFNDFFTSFLRNVNYFKLQNQKIIEMENLALTDEISGLFNQRKLLIDLNKQIKIHEKNKETFSVLFIDIDKFKFVNDNYGHIVGSNLILQLGKLLHKQVRKTDMVYRFGGDEFVVIMPKVKHKNVHPIASRLLKKIKEHSFLINDKEEYKMSVSIGICEYPTNATTCDEVLDFADKMMYESKKSGRGKVFHIKEIKSC